VTHDILRYINILTYLLTYLMPVDCRRQVLVEHNDVVSCAVVTAGNRSVVSGSHDARLLVWNMDKGDVQHQLIGHSGPVTAVTVTADGTVAVSGTSSAGRLRDSCGPVA